MRLFIGGRSRLPARFERRLDIDPLSCDTHDAPAVPGPWRCSHTSLPVVFDLILGTCVPLLAPPAANVVFDSSWIVR
jgi:hypothetical protein